MPIDDGFVDHKLLYDSCDGYVKRFLREKYRLGDLLPSCFGDENILELCNRCPYFKVLSAYNEEKSQK